MPDHRCKNGWQGGYYRLFSSGKGSPVVVSFRSSSRPRTEDRVQATFKVVVPVSGGSVDQRLIDALRRICRRQAAEITLVYVVEVDQSMPLDAELPDEVNRGESVLRGAAELARAELDPQVSHVFTELLQARSAGSAVVDEATDRNADAIMIGATLRRQFGRLTIGDTVDYVLKHAPCEVVVIRQALPDWITETMEWS
jgi:nucleotide-binding universal stress UspA family protein